MSVPRYPKYKDSGGDWLGEIPEHWRSVPVKHVGRLKGGAGFPHDLQGIQTEEIPFYKVNALAQADQRGVLAFCSDTVNRGVARDLGAFVFPPNSIVFAKVGAALLLGRIRVLDRDSCIDNNMMGLVVDNEKFDPGYVKYAMGAIRFDLIANPGAVPSLNEGQIGEVLLAVPGLHEQTQVAAFLNLEIVKLDELVADQRRLIELLKENRQAVISYAVTKGLNPHAAMKPSGVEWLGDVPTHWEVTRLGNLFREVSDPGDDGLPILSVSIHHGVSDKEIAEDDMERKVTRSEDRAKYKRVAPGDLVYNMMRAWQGGFGTTMVQGMVSPAYVVARPRKGFETVFVEYVLRTAQAVEEMRRHSQGVTDFRLRLYWDAFKNIRIAVPPVDEIRVILAHIGDVIARSREMAAASEQAIGLLQERRTALISAAVTGQIDVRNVASPAPIAADGRA